MMKWKKNFILRFHSHTCHILLLLIQTTDLKLKCLRLRSVFQTSLEGIDTHL